MGKKLTGAKKLEKLAMIAVAKTGPDDNVAEITNKVIADYFGAKEALQQYNDTLLSPKAALKLLGGKKQEKKNKTKTKVKANATAKVKAGKTSTGA